MPQYFAIHFKIKFQKCNIGISNPDRIDAIYYDKICILIAHISAELLR